MAVLSACDTLTGWTLDTSSIGTATIDSTLQTEGTGCIKYVRTVDKARNNQCFMRFTVSSTDFSDKTITFKYRWEDAAQNELRFRILNATGPAVFTTNIDRDTPNDVWRTATISLPGTWDPATFIEIFHDGDRFAGWTDAQTVTLYLDDLQINDTSRFNGIINACENLNMWSLDTNGDGTGSIDTTLEQEGSGCIKYVRVIDKARDRVCQLQVWLPRAIDPTGYNLHFKYRWDNPDNQLSFRFITVAGNPAASTPVDVNGEPNTWHTINVPITGTNISQGVDRIQFTNDGDRFAGWSEGETATLYLDDIKLVVPEEASSGFTIAECDNLQLWSLDTNGLGEASVDTVIKNSATGSLKHSRVVDHFRSGDVAATTNLTSNGILPSPGDTVTVDSVTYTYVLDFTIPTVANEVAIDGSLNVTLTNLRHAMNATGESGIAYSSTTTVHPTAAGNLTIGGTVLPMQARTVGTGGNSIATTTTSANLAFDGATMSGGGVGVKKLGSTRRLNLPYTSFPGRILSFDYRWSLPNNELYVRFLNTSGGIIPGTVATLPANVTPDTWHHARIPLDGANLSNLKHIDFYDNGDLFAGWNNGDEPILWLDNIKIERTRRRRLKSPCVAIQFDDGYKDNYTLALPIMEKYGQIATIGISTAYTLTGFFTGNNQPTLTVSEIQALADAGWEICSHSVNHVSMKLSNDATVDFEMEQSKADLEGWGFECNHFIYPYTQYRTYSQAKALELYSSATTGGPPNLVLRRDETDTIFGPTDLSRLPRVAMGSTSTLTDFKNAVLDGIKNDRLPIIYFHALTAAPATVYVLPGMFEQMMRWLKLSGIRTVTTTDGLREFRYLP